MAIKSNDIRIREWISGSPIVVEQNTLLIDAVKAMANHGIGALLICEGEKLVGIFTERDMFKCFINFSEKTLNAPVSGFMTKNPITAQLDEDYNTVYIKMKTHNIRHIPILDNGKLVGIVSIRDLLRYYHNKLETEVLNATKEIDKLEHLVQITEDDRINVLVNEIKKYEELSLTDPLTELYNKRYFQNRLTEEVARCQRYKTKLSLIFADIDNFKKINDHYGHEMGDHLLKGISQRLIGEIGELSVISRLRRSDIVARYGGEEFVVILPETGKEGSLIVAERLRNVIGDSPFSLENGPIWITMSFGVAELPHDAQDASGLIKKADTAMYNAKKQGKNRVMIANQ
ncbi:MAG: GGDEF domain-containing protein [Planctomycetes bacterium]|nr:GGDEF domain-containing protein [Planctomycetota bacterium]